MLIWMLKYTVTPGLILFGWGEHAQFYELKRQKHWSGPSSEASDISFKMNNNNYYADDVQY